MSTSPLFSEEVLDPSHKGPESVSLWTQRHDEEFTNRLAQSNLEHCKHMGNAC